MAKKDIGVRKNKEMIKGSNEKWSSGFRKYIRIKEKKALLGSISSKVNGFQGKEE